MTIKALVAATCVAAITASASSAAFAQAAAPAAPAAPAVTHGPALPGVCTVSVEGAIATSTVGKYVQTRLQQIASQVQAELSAEETAIQNEAKTLEGQRTTLDQNTFETRASALQVKANAFQRKEQQRGRELQATQQKALGRVYQELTPIVSQVYQQRQCSLLINRESVVLSNPAMDISQPVVTALNAKITQFTFDRERLDQAAAPAAAAPATRK
ncbi:outer membrane chaperone Skp [Phenylobacterium sp. Root77]|jgi:Skp family chaperone for outer membrane proteins|uniref:OmpH family outer membrane protein n=1 Tax=unclassified Phenylobacterium TaxID=2640670 RepID=UPI0006FFEBDF|nr:MULTISPECIES: OmpH family outer membrane protein [unclassified Phenylobacterium]KQW71552.1 outer membrane chaperone Skp [Phenylobacterium sp. Root1277]KQW94472.1 outer membrane chaperone Skp [Phenylobacterium sp. Root1290]KRC44166.1 outer membrane chaperone Skp [Phenylobacterium sp. Root77]